MRRRWAMAGALLAVAVLWVLGPRVARRIVWFRVDQVEFVGMRHGTPRHAAELLALPPGFTVFHPLGDVEARAWALPGVVDAEVGRRLPGTLVVTVRERRPVALVPSRGALVFMDSAGALLPFDPAGADVNLPIARRADAGVGQLLGRLSLGMPTLFARITDAHAVPGGVVLMIEGRRFLLRPDATLEEVRAVRAVAADLARQGRDFDELDGRYAGSVVVRGMAS